VIRNFALDIENLFSSSPIVLSSDFEKHFGPSDETLYMKGKVTFIDASVLNIALFLVRSGNKVQPEKYRYQYMDSKETILFRYDNSKHHPEFKTFPHHKHLLDDVVESTSPELEDILHEVSAIILGKQIS
jgi:hypothetical protein